MKSIFWFVLKEAGNALAVFCCSTFIVFALLRPIVATPAQEDIGVVPAYGAWLVRFATSGSMGTTAAYNQEVSTYVWRGLANTLVLAGGGLIVGFGLALILGAALALRKEAFSLRLASFIGVGISSLPVFLIALIATRVDPRFVASFEDSPWWIDAAQFLLPIGILGFFDGSFAELVKIIEEQISSALREPHVKAVAARGLRVPRHLGRALIVPFSMTITSRFTYVLGSAIVVEYFFLGNNGLTMRALDMLENNEPDVILAIVVVFSLFIVGAHFFNRVLQFVVDPRTRLYR